MGKLIFQTIPLCLVLILPLLSDGPAALFTQSSPRVQAREVTAFVYADGGFVQQLTAGSATYTSNFDANGFGSFGWKFTNPTGAPLQNLRFIIFLDADIDRDINTFFNEYGSLVGLALPPGAPSGAIAASSWEIDEPGFLFGNIAQHLLTGNLDNSNGVPSAAPDDVSLALGFQFGTLAPGASLTGNFLIGQTAIGGLKQTDPDSGADLYFNGYLKFASNPPAIAANTIARQQGSPTTAAIIATVSDDLTPTANLAVVPLSVPQGLSIGTLSNNNGTISANVTASCSATVGANTVVLQVTDSDGQTATGNLIVNVTANTPPALGIYASPVTVNVGQGITITPNAAPSDNGTITSLTASAPGFTGSLGVNPTNGAVTVSNAGPVGTQTVTVTAIDNCGATTTRSFSLTVQGMTDLAITKAGAPGVVLAGDSLTYRITVINNGPATATGIVVSDSLPSSLSFLSCSATSGGVCGGSGNARTVTLASLGPGSSATITLVTKVNASSAFGGVIGNTATVTAATFDPDTSNNSATEKTLIGVKDCTAPACPEVGPGLPAPLSPVSDQQTGSVLIYNFYSSSPSNPGVENTRINLTNADPGRTAFVHLFFVDGSTCAVADSTVCLTPNQTVSLEASDIDPGVSGYVVAVAVDRVSGCPIRFNSLMGDAYVKLSTGHAANLGAEAFPALKDNPAACDGSATTATLAFNGTGYGLVPRVVTLDSLPSVADGNSTLLILNRVGGNLTANAESLGSVFGLLYDDLEHSYSFSFRGGCQFRQVLSSTFPRTTPRLNQVVQAGHTGWMKLSAVEDVGLLGASLNFTPRAGSSPTAYSQGHNLHELTFTASTTITIPVSPPGC